jgi:hypothetical protein
MLVSYISAYRMSGIFQWVAKRVKSNLSRISSPQMNALNISPTLDLDLFFLELYILKIHIMDSLELKRC